MTTMTDAGAKQPFYRSMLFLMLLAMIVGVVIGLAFPKAGVGLNALPAAFLKLVRMVVGIIIFVTVALGIARLGDIRKIGRLALVSLIYFEVVTSLAFAWGALVGNVAQPGAGLHMNAASVNMTSVATFTSQAQQHRGVVDFLLGILPANPVGPFLDNNILQVLVLALFIGFGITRLGTQHKAQAIAALENVERIFFAIIGFIMKVAPLAVAGAMAFMVGNYGIGTLASLAKLVVSIYFACIVFIAVVFTIIARISGFSFWKFAGYLREEIVLAFATASGETVLPRLLAKTEHAGCSGQVSGFVLPTGYSFNLDGGSIYLTITSLFIAQAFDVHLSFWDQLTMIGIFLLTSKGIAGVAGAGMVVLASSLLLMPEIPMAGLVLALSVDRFSDPIRTVTNILGNAMATMVVARWVGERDDSRLARVLDGQPVAGDVETAAL